MCDLDLSLIYDILVWYKLYIYEFFTISSLYILQFDKIEASKPQTSKGILTPAEHVTESTRSLLISPFILRKWM